MSAKEFLESYFAAKQVHEHAWEDLWQKDLRKYFGEYFLERRHEADQNWATIPIIVEETQLSDDASYFLTRGEQHHTKRYYVTRVAADGQSSDSYRIDRIMIRCEVCEGTGRFQDEECELCGERGWDDWLD